MTVAEKPYTPTPRSLAALAMAFIDAELRDQPRGAWLLNTKVAEHLGCKANAIWPSLEAAVKAGLIERSQSHNRATQWRMASPKRRSVRKVVPAKTEPRRYSIDWPPGFVPQFNTVCVPSYEERRK